TLGWRAWRRVMRSQPGACGHSPALRPSSSVDEVEDVAVRILEPRDLDVSEDVNVAFELRAGHVVVLEAHALGLQLTHDGFHFVHRAGRPCRIDYGPFAEAMRVKCL